MNFNIIQAVSFSLLKLCNESEAETVVTYNHLHLQPGVLGQCLQPSLCPTEGWSRDSLVTFCIACNMSLSIFFLKMFSFSSSNAELPLHSEK